MHHCNSVFQRVFRAGKIDLLAIEENLALGRLVEADENVHERRFSRAVFSHKAADGAGGNGEAYIPQGKLRKGFLNVRQLNGVCHGVCHGML